MQFTSIIAALSMALAATALPSPNSPPPPTCAQGSTVECCTTSGLSILECGVIPLATCGLLNGGQQACCQTTQSGILDISLCNLL